MTACTRIVVCLLAAVCSLGTSLTASAQEHPAREPFVCAAGGRLTLGGKPYCFVGANAWYLPLLATDSVGDGIVRLRHELDVLHRMGIDNLRVLVGADGMPAARKVAPVMQTAPGGYDQRMLTALDRFLVEAGERGMKVVLYLTNAWAWSGGMTAYLRWVQQTGTEVMDTIVWRAWCEHASQFATSMEARQLYYNHVRAIVGRRNSLTGELYANDATIMAWQICNEPRAFSARTKEAFAQWIAESAALIKSLDSRHLVSTGSEGSMGCELDMQLYEQLHADPNVDYLTVHVWPMNWGWVQRGSIASRSQSGLRRQQLDAAIGATRTYVAEHEAVARRLHKPLVVEEFGYPRDGGLFDIGTTTTARDAYYSAVFSLLTESVAHGGPLAGCNFWGWSGAARPNHLWWQPYDPYLADPAQEEQGLYGVWDSDTTVGTVRRAVRRLQRILRSAGRERTVMAARHRR